MTETELFNAPMQTGIFPDIPVSRYHLDPCETISLSASIAAKLILECPIIAWAAHPKLGNERGEPTRAMQFGTVVHHKFSGVETEIEIVYANDYKTKAAQQARDAALAGGKTPILEHELVDAQAVAESARKACNDAGLSLSGDWERVIMWDDDGVQCRGLLDHIDLTARPYILDLKTCSNANPKQLGKKIVDEGYDIQAAAYLSAVAKIRPDLAGRIPFFFCFIETSGKYLSSIVQPDESMLHLGRMRWKQAKRMWGHYLAEYGMKPWPGYARGITTVYPTNWQVQEATLDLEFDEPEKGSNEIPNLCGSEQVRGIARNATVSEHGREGQAGTPEGIDAATHIGPPRRASHPPDQASLRQCEGKAKHRTEAEANIEITLSDEKGLHAYLCGVCGGWHVGHYAREPFAASEVDQASKLRLMTKGTND